MMNRRQFLTYSAQAALAPCVAGCNSSSSFSVDTSGTKQVVVVGAGIAGLTCAYSLRSQDILVLESNSVVGGRTVSSTRSAFTYAKGTEYLGAPGTTFSRILSELNVEAKEIPSPMDGYFDGSSFYYGSAAIKTYLVNNSSQTAYDAFVNLVKTAYADYAEIPNLTYNSSFESLDNKTARQWLQDNSVPSVFINKYNVMSKGLFGATLDEISALCFIPEAAFDYGGKSTSTDTSSGAYSFMTGITDVTNALATALQSKISLNSTVSSVESVGSGLYRVTYKDAHNATKTVLTQKIVLAVPAPIALKIASPLLSATTTDILGTVKYAPYITVALFSNSPIFSSAFDLAVPDQYFFTDLYDATWVQRYYDSSKTSTAEYIATVYVAPATSTDTALASMSDATLLNNIYTDLNKVVASASSLVTGYDIQRFAYAYPVMPTGAYKRLLQLDTLNHGAVILAGDYTIYPTFESAIQSGILASQRINGA